MAEDVVQREKEQPSSEDLKFAELKLKEFKKIFQNPIRWSSTSAIIEAIARVADKLCRDDTGAFKPGWFYNHCFSVPYVRYSSLLRHCHSFLRFAFATRCLSLLYRLSALFAAQCLCLTPRPLHRNTSAIHI